MTLDEADAILSSVFPAWIAELKMKTVGIEAPGVRLRLPPSENIVRVGGFTAGQVSLAVGDTAMVMAVAAHVGEFCPVSTVSLTASFLRPLANKGIICEAQVSRVGRSLAFCKATLRGEDRPEASVELMGSYAMPVTH